MVTSCKLALLAHRSNRREPDELIASERPVALSRRALSALPPGVSAPGYDPAAVSAGIVHLGLGGFHRAHMARYTHELMELDPAALRWGTSASGCCRRIGA